MSYLEHLAENRRLVILRLLSAASAYRANDSVVHTGLDRYGHGVTRDQVRSDLAWLEEQGLVHVERLGSVVIATLSERGHDAAEGRATVPGVKRPSPK